MINFSFCWCLSDVDIFFSEFLMVTSFAAIFSFTSVEKLVEQFHALPHYGLMPMSGKDGEAGIGIRLESGTLLLETAGIVLLHHLLLPVKNTIMRYMIKIRPCPFSRCYPDVTQWQKQLLYKAVAVLRSNNFSN